MTPANLSGLERVLRRAVALGSYEEAADVLARYCAAAKRAIDERGDGAEARQLAAHAARLLQWALCVVRTGRALRRLELSRAASVCRYQPPRRNTATLSLDA